MAAVTVYKLHNTVHLVARGELGGCVQGEAIVAEWVVNVLKQVLQGTLH